MEYACFDINGFGPGKLEYIGMCRLAPGQEDPPGTGHMFGDVCFTLAYTDGSAMLFTRDEVQPYLKHD